MKIVSIKAREILDSRGFPTVQADVRLSDGSLGSAMVPSGASTGSHEAVELRDGGKRYNGKGVLNAVKNVAKIEKALLGKDAKNIRAIDEAMIKLDGTHNKGKLGANAILAVSMAVLRAGAVSAKKPLYQYIRQAYNIKEKDYLLPAPMLNIINGGKHADSGLDVQEFMIVPAAAANFKDGLRAACEIYHTLKKILAKKGMVTAVGDEGGFAPKISRHEGTAAIILIGVFIMFLTNSLHGIPDVAVCLAAVFIFFISGVLESKDFNTAVNWDIVIFIGTAISLGSIFTETGISLWLSGIIVPAIGPITANPWIFTFTIVTIMFLWRFVDVAIFIPTIAILVPILPAIQAEYQIHPLIWLAAIVMATNAFFMAYQNIWAVMSRAIAGDRAWGNKHMGIYGTLYFAACLIALTVAIPMWTNAGLFG